MLGIFILSSVHLFEHAGVRGNPGIYSAVDIPYKSFRMRKYDYFIRPDMVADSLLSSYNRMTVEAVDATDSIYFNFILRDSIYGNDITIDSIRFIFAGDTIHPSHYTVGDTFVVVHLPYTVTSGQRFVVEVHYHGHAYARPSFAWGSDFYVGMHWEDSAVYTHSEYYGTRNWLPVFDNLYEKVDTVDARIKVPYGWFAVSNGKLVDSVLEADGIVYHWRESHGITPYMIVFAALNRDRYFVLNGDWSYDTLSMEVLAYMIPDVETTLTYMLDGLSIFSGLFGPYPFADEKYSEVQLGGGVEYQTNTFFIPLPFFDNEIITAHELSHQWWGGYVTCGTYDDLWLNEGFATYSEVLYKEQKYGPDEAEIHRRTIFGSYMGIPTVYDHILASPDYSTTAWTYIVYFKGAAVLHMIRYRFWRLYGGTAPGDSAFFEFLRYYREQHARSYVITDDLKGDLEAFTGVDWDGFFQQWVYTPGHPVLEVRWRKEMNAGLWDMVVQVEQVQSPSWGYYTVDYPVRIVFSDSSVVDTILPLTGSPSDTFYFSFVSEPAGLVMDPQGHILDRIQLLVAMDENPAGFYRAYFRGNVLNVITPSEGKFLVRVYDVAGRLVHSGRFSGNRYGVSLNVPTGIYVVEIASGEGKRVFRVLK